MHQSTLTLQHLFSWHGGATGPLRKDGLPAGVIAQEDTCVQVASAAMPLHSSHVQAITERQAAQSRNADSASRLRARNHRCAPAVLPSVIHARPKSRSIQQPGTGPGVCYTPHPDGQHPSASA